MKKGMIILITILWMAAGLQLAVAQERYEETEQLYIELRFDERGFETMKRNAGEKGITASDLGAWMERSGNVMIKGEVTYLNSNSYLSVYTIDTSGMMSGKESMQVKLSERPTIIGQATGGMMPRLVDGLMAYDAFMAVDMFTPQLDYADSPQTAEQLMMNAAQQAMRSSRSEMAVVVMIAPDEQRYSSKVSPGVVIFTGSGK